ncbi:MAG: ABC transporter ATP-binding protein [Chloroflexi bacterium]|nr:ABC transporter ATP-binding protein [Chloroflexota bacterium]MDA1240442.1 ABC transporter ATP-binding protein [Chloroflexota bacterium]MQC25733.1 ABC transporter ATP-binding protein [Chloroflexota bacterium]MQC48184.1 ABC transporter ATP-binding protein [Chloroflexota bacterium]
MAAPVLDRSPLLEARDIRVRIGERALVDGVSLTLMPGEVLGLVGPNGAGKSTLLRAITGDRKAEGEVAVSGRPLRAIPRRDLFRMMAVVQQLPEAPPAITVRELTLLGRFPHLGLLGRESAHDQQIADASIVRAGCEAFADRPLATLSGGERRRAFIARALAQEPRLLLLDEPTANLDAEAQAEVLGLLRRLATEGVGVLVVLHDLSYAAAYCDRLMLLHHGRLMAEGPASRVITAEHISAVYGPHVRVLAHPEGGAPLVVPAL